MTERNSVRLTGNATWTERARSVLPSGVTHDMRYLRPTPTYVTRAAGSHKWDVDGSEYVDYWMGHGALLLGHCHPAVVKALTEAVSSVTHAGGCHPQEVEWAELVVSLIPSAEQVRFTGSGTEATLLALRLARAATRRPRIIKFEGHFHGWHDYASFGVNPPFDVPASIGIPEAVAETVVVLPPDLGAVAAELAMGDVAGVILEPTGASMGLVPIAPDLLRGLRSLCDEHGAVLVFDEVITAFRYAPGGVQQLTGVLPDLTALGKILAGGLPGGAVAGREEIMDLLSFHDDPKRDRYERVPHTGTFNANPPSAAAGVTTLRLVSDGEAGSRAVDLAAALREGLQDVIKRLGARWSVLGESSIFHWLPIAIEELDEMQIGGSDFTSESERRKQARSISGTEAMRNALLHRGVDFPGYEGWVSAAHSEEDVERTIHAFEEALEEIGTLDD